jgi:hypothetical protein
MPIQLISDPRLKDHSLQVIWQVVDAVPRLWPHAWVICKTVAEEPRHFLVD